VHYATIQPQAGSTPYIFHTKLYYDKDIFSDRQEYAFEVMPFKEQVHGAGQFSIHKSLQKPMSQSRTHKK